jgi:hypothetical protein
MLRQGKITMKDGKLSGDRNQCPGCNEYFNSTAAFEQHRTGDYTSALDPRRCLKPTQMIAKRMRKNAEGFWLTNKANGFAGYAEHTE